MGEALISGAGGGAGAKIYRWKRYNVNSTTTYYWNKYNRVSSTIYRWNKYSLNATYNWNKYEVAAYTTSIRTGTRGGSGSFCYVIGGNWSFDSVNGVFSGYVDADHKGSIIKSGAYVSSGDSYPVYWIPNKWDSYGFSGTFKVKNSNMYKLYGTNPYYNSNAHSLSNMDADKYTAVKSSSPSRGSYISAVTSESSSTYPDNGVHTDNYWYEKGVTTYSKGSTSYGQVTSSSSSAYPANGASGSYWYESAGSSTSYSKGSTSYGQVSSTNRSAYPDNSYSGSYWYVYSTSSVSYSQGSYVDDVFGMDPNMHPQNGKDGSYWYVYDGEAN